MNSSRRTTPPDGVVDLVQMIALATCLLGALTIEITNCGWSLGSIFVVHVSDLCFCGPCFQRAGAGWGFRVSRGRLSRSRVTLAVHRRTPVHYMKNPHSFFIQPNTGKSLFVMQFP